MGTPQAVGRRCDGQERRVAKTAARLPRHTERERRHRSGTPRVDPQQPRAKPVAPSWLLGTEARPRPSRGQAMRPGRWRRSADLKEGELEEDGELAFVEEVGALDPHREHW